MNSSSLMVVATLAVIGANAVWYGAKLFLRSHGVRVGWFSGHTHDFGNLKTLAVHGESELVRSAAKRWLLTLRISVGFVITAIVVAFFVDFVLKVRP